LKHIPLPEFANVEYAEVHINDIVNLKERRVIFTIDVLSEALLVFEWENATIFRFQMII
jgi:hypothetical protein